MAIFYRCKDIFGYCSKDRKELAEIDDRIYEESNRRMPDLDKIITLRERKSELMECEFEPETCPHYKTVSQIYGKTAQVTIAHEIKHKKLTKKEVQKQTPQAS